MKQKRSVILPIAIMWLLCACQSNPFENTHEKNKTILNRLDSVSKENIYRTVEQLQNFETRYSWEKQEEVAGYLFGEFQKYGIPVEFDEYDFRGKKWKNVIATIHGREKGDENFMVIAHYDSVSKQPETSAPGADDNASGCAAVLEIGRVLREVPLAATVRLGIFSNEEQGAAGSKHFAGKARDKNINLKGVINLDIIGYNDPIGSLAYKTSKVRGWTGAIKTGLKTIRNHTLKSLYPDGIVEVGGRPPDQKLVNHVSALAQKYSRLKVRTRVDENCG